jgi:hypothetical protein
MCKRIFTLLAIALGLFGTQCWAATCTPGEEGGVSCTNTFDANHPTGTYDFSGTGDGVLIVKFNTVLTTFDLKVSFTHTIDSFDPNEFPAGTVAVTYSNGNQDQYDFTGNAGGPNGVPVKNKDYQGLITLTLSFYSGAIQDPAFAHAPEYSTTFTEDILTSYSTSPESDPTMGGKLPGLSSVVAADKHLTSNDIFCSLTTAPTNNPSGQKSEIEVTLKIVGNGSDCSTGTGLRDKTASLSVWTYDSNGNVSFLALKNVEGNKFHWDNKNGVNEYDISTDGLVSGQKYYVTVFSSLISPQTTTFTF